MKKHISFLIILSLVLVPIITYSADADNEFVAVKIGKNNNITDNVELFSESGFSLYEKYDLEREVYEIPDEKIIISIDNNEIDILDTSYDLITSIPGDGSLVIGSNGYNDSIVKVGENRYRDYITFIIKGDIYYTINYINIEKYLLGVVPREMGSNFPIEALKAQAIVARSFTYVNINKHMNEGYNLCDTTHCQVYGGYDNENDNTTQAVLETNGEYVTYNDEIIETPYHSTSGGYTESSKSVWGGEFPYLVAVEDSFSSNSPNSSWQFQITAAELQSKLLSSGINIGDIQDVMLLDTSETNRVLNVKIVGTSGEKTISGNQFRDIVGATSLKSTLFDIERNGGSSNSSKVYVIDGDSFHPNEIDASNAYIIDGKENKGANRGTVSRAIDADRTSNIGSNTYNSKSLNFVFDGKGYGHGVGMSQYGAMEMAKQGYNYKEIITHYYSGVKIKNIDK
jgi:stage II sporulation protein D